MKMAHQQHTLLDLINGSQFEDIYGDLHFCSKCQMQFSSLHAFVNHRIHHCHLAVRHSPEVSLNAVQVCGPAEDAGGQPGLLPLSEGSAVQSPAAPVQQLPHPALVSVPVLSAAGAPLELLVQVTQPAETAAAADPPPRKKRLRPRNHVCDICGHRCAFPKDLVRHKFKHTNEKFRCSVCGALYSRPDKLAEHERLAHRQPEARRRRACTVEGCTFRGASGHHVKKHMRDRHSDERPHSCQVCSYAAKHPHQLTVHLRSHTGDRPYPCQEPDCGRTFRTSWDLRRHQLLHTGDQPFGCQLCSFASAFKGNYYKHLRNIHGIDKDGNKIPEKAATGERRTTTATRRGRGRDARPLPANFWCDQCTCSFVRNEAYLVHLATHSDGARPAVGSVQPDGTALPASEIAAPSAVPRAESGAQSCPDLSAHTDHTAELPGPAAPRSVPSCPAQPGELLLPVPAAPRSVPSSANPLDAT
ncbi:zinc finger protein 64-like isoform X2 [Amphibalanus amphitrite]|uniref:zinc finger protein 64-like isoform X2 n=1 Tax=Amphibalanus amphitrite TaxID=1232801 RepID=UPI001C91F6E0|nr:zinc finger protein 64-like isoform X2 [Amphibalanus amphitrite]